MKACLSVPDVLSRTECVLAPSCEFDCEFGCEGSNGSIYGGGRSGRVSSTPWDDLGGVLVRCLLSSWWQSAVTATADDALAVEQSAEGDVGGVTGPCA